MTNPNNIYFDNAATTPLHPEVADYIYDLMKSAYGNPSSIHSLGRKAKGLLEESRVSIAKYMGCSPSEIYFTSGGTESNNIALRKAVHCLGVKNIITTPIEHHAVLGTAQNITKIHPAIKLHLLTVDSKGGYSLEQLEELLKKNPNSLVSLMHANNELGNLADLNTIGSLCKQYGAYFHTDAVQTVGYFKYHLDNSNIDLLSASAHKFNGPKGVGFMYIKKGVKMEPLITGGGQERNMRAGTENVASIAGMAKAVAMCYDHLESKISHIKGIRQYFKEQISIRIPTVTFNGDTENSHYTILNVCLPMNEGADMFLFSLDLQGISASGGSACNSGASKASHVLQAISGNENYANIRFSFGVYNKKEEVDSCINALCSLLQVPA